MIRRALIATSLASLVACSLLAPPGGYSEGAGETPTPEASTAQDTSSPVDVVVAEDGRVTVPGSAGTLVVFAGAHDPVSADDDPAFSGDVWTGILDDKGKVALWHIEKSVPIVGPFDGVTLLGGVLFTMGFGLGVNGGRNSTLQSIGWAPGLMGDYKSSRVDMPGGLDQPGRLMTDSHVLTFGGFRTVTDDAGTNTFAVKEVHPATIDPAANKVGAFANIGVSLQNARANPSSAVVNGMIYVVGGRTNGTNLIASVEASKYSAVDAKVDGFANQPNLTKGGADYKPFQPEVFGDRGFLFVAGGRTDTGNTMSDTVLSAPIKTDGSLDPWLEVNALPAPLRNFGVVVWKDVVYVLGGVTTAGRVDDVYSATVNADGTLGTWSSDNAKLPGKRSDIVGVAY